MVGKKIDVVHHKEDVMIDTTINLNRGEGDLTLRGYMGAQDGTDE